MNYSFARSLVYFVRSFVCLLLVGNTKTCTMSFNVILYLYVSRAPQELNSESILHNKSNLITFLKFLYTHTYKIYEYHFISFYYCSFCFHFTEADYTLDDSFWNDESPVGKFNIHSLTPLFIPIQYCFWVHSVA